MIPTPFTRGDKTHTFKTTCEWCSSSWITILSWIFNEILIE